MGLSYTVRRSAKRKKLTITVERDCRVIVNAPQDASDERVAQIVDAKRQWIYEKSHHMQKYKTLPHPPGKELVSGESAMYLGRNYRIEIVPGAAGEVRFEQRFLVPDSHRRGRGEVLRDWYIARAKDRILPRVSRHAHELGVKYSRARIVDNRYRWGSCTERDNINLNWRLIKAPMFVIDYVVVHELAHLMEGNHTPRFWNIVQAQVPMTEKARAWLKDNGQLLEEGI